MGPGGLHPCPQVTPRPLCHPEGALALSSPVRWLPPTLSPPGDPQSTRCPSSGERGLWSSPRPMPPPPAPSGSRQQRPGPGACGHRGSRKSSRRGPACCPAGLASPQQGGRISDEEAARPVHPHQVVPGEDARAPTRRAPTRPGHQAPATIFRQDVTKGLAEACGSTGGQRQGTGG